MKKSSDAPVSGLSTTHQQNLQPLGIYTVNRMLDEIKDVDEIKKYIGDALDQNKGNLPENKGNLSVVPVLFNKHKRTFRQAAVASERLDIKDNNAGQAFNKEAIALFQDIRKDRNKENGSGELYNSFKSAIKEAQSQILFDAYADKFSLLEAFIEKEPTISELQGLKWLEIVELLHVLYFSIEYSRTDALAGILYTRIEQRSSEPAIDYFRGHLDPCSTEEEYSPGGKLHSIVGNFYFCNGNSDEKNSYQQSDKSLSRILKELGNLLYASSGAEDDEVFAAPIWDSWYAGKSYGGLWGILTFRFPRDNGKTEDRQNLVKHFMGRCEALSGQLFSSGIAAIAHDDLDPPYDLTDHFVRTLTWVQDWECAVVYDGHNKKKLFCYRRAKDGSAQIWKRCEEQSCKLCETPEEDGHTKFKLGYGTESPIWNRKFVPELTEYEISRYRNYRFEFQFPKVSLLPNREDEHERKRFEEVIVRRQKTVLGLLAFRLREKRYALRRAVTGIMGRNMSHNIGSHVLARYASEIGADSVAGGRADDQRSDLLRYLQRRMDFLADVATSDMSFWFQSLSLKEQIDRLNWEEQKKRFKYDRTQAMPVLLRFITGKDGLKASVDYHGDDVYFASPAGEVGVHALFVILENIIRNSARHGSTADDVVALGVSLGERDQDSNLLELEIVDLCSSVKPNCEVTLTLATSVDDDTAVTVCYTEPTENGANPIRDRKGKPAPTFCVAAADGAGHPERGCGAKGPMPVATAITGNALVLTFDKALDPDSTPAKEAFSVTAGGRSLEVSMVAIAKRLDDRINHIIKEPILASNGEPKAENWGIREMQICAHYLRGFSLFDLESAPGGDCPILQAGCHDKWLKYTIYLQRAKRMAVVRKPQGDANSELEGEGIKIIEPTDCDWCAISAKVKGYEYLVVESGINRLRDSLRDGAKASLPIRRLELPCKDIGDLIVKAKEGGSLWMETLHKRWATETRARRAKWKKGNLFGVSICTSDRALPEPECSWPPKEPDDGLIFAVTETDTKTRPLPVGAETWLNRLNPAENGKPDVIAAAWIDHAESGHFSTIGCGLGYSIQELTDSIDKYHERLWISVEDARSGDPHTRFLTDAYQNRNKKNKRQEWEILAAAVSRVAVLDERIQSAGSQDSSVSGKSRHDLWRYMGVWTPKKPLEECANGCDLDNPDFDQCRGFLKSPPSREDQYPIDILVVHLTILERLAQHRNESLSTVLQCLRDDTQAKDAEVVVVTGRGVPSVARAAGGDDGSALEGVRYLPISALLESLVARPSKLALMRTLWSAGVPSSHTA